MKKFYYISFSIILPLLLAFCIYLLCRPESTVVFTLFNNLFPDSIVDTIRIYGAKFSNNLPNWFIFSLPGGLWLFSFQNTIRFLNNFKLQKELKIGIAISILSSIGLECFQLLKITDGRFDKTDILFYGLAILSSFLLSKRHKELGIPCNINRKLTPILLLTGFTAIVYLADVI